MLYSFGQMGYPKYLSFTGSLSKSSVLTLINNLRSTGHTRLLVDSPGGQFEFFSILGPRIQRMNICTIAGNVRSAAVILYLLGQYRCALPDSTFFFHEVRTLIAGTGYITVSDAAYAEDIAREQLEGKSEEMVREWVRGLQYAQSWFLSFLSAHTGVPIPTFLSLMRNEVTLSARDAQRYGLVHRILSHDELEHSLAL